MATSKISVSEGSGKNLATHTIIEDAVSKDIQRVVVSDSAGSDISLATTELQVIDSGNGFSLTNTTNRTFSATTTTGSFIVTSAALFSASDLGRAIEGTGIPANAIITSVNSTSSVTFKTPPTTGYPQGQPATASGSVTVTVRVGFAGTYVATRSAGVKRILTVLGASVSDGTAFPTNLGGTFCFMFSEDGVTPTIIEVRAITDFTSVRDLS